MPVSVTKRIGHHSGLLTFWRCQPRPAGSILLDALISISKTPVTTGLLFVWILLVITMIAAPEKLKGTSNQLVE
jgi:hypothetical protein